MFAFISLLLLCFPSDKNVARHSLNKVKQKMYTDYNIGLCVEQYMYMVSILYVPICKSLYVLVT